MACDVSRRVDRDVNCNFEDGFYLTRALILTVDWKADSSQPWMVSLGGGVGKVFHFGKLPVKTQVSAYYNVVKPDNGATWQIRARVQLMVSEVIIFEQGVMR